MQDLHRLPSEVMEYVATNVPARAPGQFPEKGTVKQAGGDLVFGPVSGMPGPGLPVERASAPSPVFALCPHPDHGLEGWQHSIASTADSGWRGGGSDPQSYCGSQKLTLEAANPDRNVTLTGTTEDHRATYNPFKHDEYRYVCAFSQQWGPIYRQARSASCGLR
jgi:hypothetical protein